MKFRVVKISECESHMEGERVQEIKLVAEYDASIPEDKLFEKMTPTAECKFRVKNPILIDTFHLGDHYYLNLTKV